jgi:hypothetical protein
LILYTSRRNLRAILAVVIMVVCLIWLSVNAKGLGALSIAGTLVYSTIGSIELNQCRPMRTAPLLGFSFLILCISGLPKALTFANGGERLNRKVGRPQYYRYSSITV